MHLRRYHTQYQMQERVPHEMKTQSPVRVPPSANHVVASMNHVVAGVKMGSSSESVESAIYSSSNNMHLYLLAAQKKLVVIICLHNFRRKP